MPFKKTPRNVTICNGCCLQLFLSLVLFLNVSIAFAVTEIEQSPPRIKQQLDEESNPQKQRQGRTPPKVAIDACLGKEEGDPCSFNNGKETLGGECLSGKEQIFACRPHRKDNNPVGAQIDPKGKLSGTHQISPPPSPRAVLHGNTDTSEDKTSGQQLPHKKTPVIPASEYIDQPSIQTLPAPVNTIQKSEILTDAILLNSGLCLLVAFGSICFTWYICYRNSTLPLRRLRKVTQKLAGGDLSARVGEGLVQRKNEVSDLARDVDRMAERIEGLVGSHQRLIRDVSHELRSPLARLNVALELARQSAGSGTPAPFDRIERESERLNELIGQLLMLTKLESESGMNRQADISISDLILEVTHDVDFEASSNERNVHVTGCESLFFNGDKELLRQALENLVRNAIRYTPPGTAVEVSLKRTESAGRAWAHIEVRDYGPGVPESELTDIFRPFYRVGDARERQSGGTGVGLAISDRAVRLHGGRLRALNAAGGGLRMEMDLPLH